MAVASDSDLTTRIPATLGVSLAMRTLALADAGERVDDAAWAFGGQAVRAQTLLAAHYLQLIPLSGMPGAGPASGVVASRSAGAISVSYAIPTIPPGWDPSIASTDYGRQFLSILDGLMSVPEVG